MPVKADDLAAKQVDDQVEAAPRHRTVAGSLDVFEHYTCRAALATGVLGGRGRCLRTAPGCRVCP